MILVVLLVVVILYLLFNANSEDFTRTHNNIHSEYDCGRLCDRTNRCKSHEHDPVRNQCRLEIDTDTDTDDDDDYNDGYNYILLPDRWDSRHNNRYGYRWEWDSRRRRRVRRHGRWVNGRWYPGRYPGRRYPTTQRHTHRYPYRQTHSHPHAPNHENAPAH